MMASVPCSPDQRFVFARVEAPAAPHFLKQTPGVWYFLNPGEAPWIVCPECAHAGRLGNHQVKPDGTVEPSIVCPMAECGDGVARCSAHYYGRLADWGPR